MKLRHTIYVLFIIGVSSVLGGFWFWQGYQNDATAMMFCGGALMILCVWCVVDDLLRAEKCINQLKQEAAQNAGRLVGPTELPPGTYEVVGRITCANDWRYGYVVRNTKSTQHHCILNDYELHGSLIVEPGGRTHEEGFRTTGSMSSRGSVS